MCMAEGIHAAVSAWRPNSLASKHPQYMRAWRDLVLTLLRVAGGLGLSSYSGISTVGT